jgi:hypothetical protein
MSESRGLLPDDGLIARVRGEYLEMPGLRLTLEQARRLWGLDSQSCRSVLGTLIENGFLARDTDGRYARRTDEKLARPTLRMARAGSALPTPAAKTGTH